MGKKELTLFEKLLPVSAVVLAGLALFGQGSPDWVRYAAVGIALLLAVAWLLAEAGWLGKAIKSKLFRSKLTKDQAVRLSVLLDEIRNHMSYSYTLSPFSVWHSCSNEYLDSLRMNYGYHSAIHVWLQDLKAKCDEPRADNTLLLGSLSKAIYEASKLAEQAERELQQLLGHEQLTDAQRQTIKKNWDSARTHFNQWIEKWRALFREVEKTAHVECVQYFRPLEMIG
ncbi:MAG: hypothetical protein IE917_11200 [Betaproteobacteria bacterium]|nr:hypothetical protein [Betaproteobacteria bacterium]